MSPSAYDALIAVKLCATTAWDEPDCFLKLIDSWAALLEKKATQLSEATS